MIRNDLFIHALMVVLFRRLYRDRMGLRYVHWPQTNGDAGVQKKRMGRNKCGP